MKTSQVLMQALDIIDTPGKWTKEVYARDRDGSPTFPNSNNAVCFCSLGAVQKVLTGQSPVETFKAIFALTLPINNKVGGLGGIGDDIVIVNVNDKATSPFDPEMAKMWLGAIFTALADEESR